MDQNTDVSFLHVKTASRLCYNNTAAIQFVRQWPWVNPLPLCAGSIQKVLKPESWRWESLWMETQERVRTWVTSVFPSVYEWGTSGLWMKSRIWQVYKWCFSCCPQDHFINNSGNRTLFKKTFHYTQSTVNPFTLLKQVHNVTVHL